MQGIIQGAKATYNKTAGKYAHIGASENILKGLIKCGACGKNLTRYKKVKNNKTKPQKVYYFHICPSCKNSISEQLLTASIKQSVNTEINLYTDTAHIIKKIRQVGILKNKASAINERTAIAKKIERLEIQLTSLYNDYAENIITGQEYFFAKAKYRDEKLLLEQKANCDPSESQPENFDFSDEENFLDAIFPNLIERIEIYEKNKVSITFKYSDEYKKLLLQNERRAQCPIHT